jgi:phosphoserine phosphatase RsbU/P
MEILIADDDQGTRVLLASLLSEAGYQVREAEDGQEALAILQGKGAPPIAILDWLMPEMDGIEVCRRLKSQGVKHPPYLILLTIKNERDDTIAGLEAGADDFVGKPFDRGILRARVRAGERLITLQKSLTERVAELEEALRRVKVLSGLLPICSQCKKIRDDQGYWNQVEAYVSKHADVRFTHGLCPECATSLNASVDWDALKKQGEERRKARAKPKPPAAGDSAKPD